MTARAVVALGAGQCVVWGVLYYAFAVLVLPVGRDLGVRTWVVAGAFSLALLMSAALAPTVGRWTDEGHAAVVMQTGGYSAAVLLAVWALIPSLATLYVVWTALGLCMAATLYEPAFAVVGRTHDDPTRRLRALATVTLLGGLASTVFLPATALLVGALGWRGAVATLAFAVAASTYATRVLVFIGLPFGPMQSDSQGEGTSPSRRPTAVAPRFGFVRTIFSVASFAVAALTANLIPALTERGISPGLAAVLGGSLGVMQLPGRALLMFGVLAGSPLRLVTTSLLLQGSGLVGLALARSTRVLTAGVFVFAAGAGLTALVRPHLVQTLFASEGAGYVNGRIARSQQFARAAGPILVAWLADSVGYAVVYLLLGSMLAMLAPIAHAVLKSVSRGASPRADG